MTSLMIMRSAEIGGATLGKLKVSNGLELITIERAWLNNQPFVSCIPDGHYQLEWDTTGRIRNVPRLRNVPERSQINIHAANLASELHGCIAVGMVLGGNMVEPRVERSKEAMGLLMESLGLKKYISGQKYISGFWHYKGMGRKPVAEEALQDQDPLQADGKPIVLSIYSMTREI